LHRLGLRDAEIGSHCHIGYFAVVVVIISIITVGTVTLQCTHIAVTVVLRLWLIV